MKANPRATDPENSHKNSELEELFYINDDSDRQPER